MPPRTLASVSGRTAGHTDASLVSLELTPAACGSQRPRKRVKKLKDDHPSAKTESIYSDDPVPASSGVFSPTISRFSLEKSFPSILSTYNLMKRLEGRDSTDSLRPLCQVFLTCLDTIVFSMADLPYGVRYHPDYEVAQLAVEYAGTLLKVVIDPQVEAAKTTQTDYAETLKHVKVVVRTLRLFLKAAERVFAASKPLPALPPVHIESPIIEEPESLLDSVEEVMKSEEAPDCPVSQDESRDTSSGTSPRKSRYASIISKVVRRRATVNESLASQFAQLTPTLVDRSSAEPQTKDLSAPPARESFSAQAKDKPADMPYLPRKSMIYFLADPDDPEVDVDMPLPTGDTVAVRLDHTGNIKAASLTALVRILTSMEGVLNEDFTPTFFVGFRFFTTPCLFLDALIRRFDEALPDIHLTTTQLEVWVRSRINDQIRVGKTVFLWLHLYWKEDADAEALPALQEFVIDRLVQTIPSLVGDPILNALAAVGGDVPFCQRSRKAYDLNAIYKYGGQVVLPPNNFIFVIDDTLENITVQLLTFDTPIGREQFARQLTIRISGVFRQVDPEDAMKYWHLKEDNSRKAEADGMEVSQVLKKIIEFERALCSWVTFSVLDECSSKQRRVVLEFWLDISAAVNTPSKMQFHVLQKFFGSQDNYANYREVLSSVEPTVPFIAPFIRDIISALNVVPTSVGAADESTKNMINFCAYRVVLKTVRSMESCLIPYDIAKSETFHPWLENVLQRFPSEAEEKLNDTFYVQSKMLEKRDPDLSNIEPWDFTVKGSLNSGEYTLQSVPPLPLVQKMKTKENPIAALFRRIR
ncbi:hypothetical protein C0991_010278 [Blastosporella zonata]|nr:hypothetical protein C0991_010278 [Blastosporella zonata]